MSRRALIVLFLSGVGVLFVVGCSRNGNPGFIPEEASTGSLEISVTRDRKTYSLRSDPDTEFIRKESYGGMRRGSGRGHTAVFSDGRLVMTQTDRRGKPEKRFVKQLSDKDMSDLLTTIAGSGLMDHDHSKARIATFRNPMPGRGLMHCSDCATVVLTFRLAEDNCPGRGAKAPITARTVYPSSLPSFFSYLPSYGEIPELVALHKISNYLSHF